MLKNRKTKHETGSTLNVFISGFDEKNRWVEVVEY